MSLRREATAALMLRTSLAALAVFVAAGSAALHGSDGRVIGIRVTSVVQRSDARDRPPIGRLSTGDTVRMRSVLRNAAVQFGRPHGVVIGHDVAMFTVLSPPIARVTVTATLPGGTIRARGRVRIGAATTRVPVLGGTGRYRGVRGAVYARNLDGQRSLNVYRLNLP